MTPPRKAYLAGKMSGEPEHGFPPFVAAAKDLRARGIDVVSPVEMDLEDGFDHATAQDTYAGSQLWGEFLARDLTVIAQADVEAVIVLPGWEQSTGASWEVRWARQLGKPVLAYPDLQPVSQEVRIVNAETGGAKGRKPQRMELVPWQAVAVVSEVYGFGASKYDDHNWLRGYQWSLSFGALMRHLSAWWSGEDTDPESGLSHMAHAGFHVLALLTFEQRFPSLDDRPPAAVSTPA